MPKQGQIIPEYLVPHVQTYINDNSLFEDFTSTPSDNGVRLLCVFASQKGEDRVLKTITSVSQYIEEYGVPNYNLYGQPCYMPYAALSSGNAKCLCMRIMPDNAKYANTAIVAKVKSEMVNGKKTMKLKYDAVMLPQLFEPMSWALELDSTTMAEPSVDDQGYSQYPIVGVRSKGRGEYGNTLRVRFASDILSDAENKYKNYVLEVLDSDNGLVKKETWRSSLYNNAVISRESIFLDDVLNDASLGSQRIETITLNKNLEAVYKFYLKQLDTNETPVAIEEFDFLFGKKKDGTAIPHVEIETTGIAIDRADGILFGSGNDGSFNPVIPQIHKTVANKAAMLALTNADVTNGKVVKCADTGDLYQLGDDTNISAEASWAKLDVDRDAAMNAEYLKAFAGIEPYDVAIKSKRRAPVELILDANYTDEVKRVISGLALKRYDARCVLDAGIISTVSQVKAWAEGVKSISDRIISKECQHFKIRDPFNGKTIPMTATYFIAENLPSHYRIFGNHIPFVGESYAKLSGYVKNSLKPVIDADDLKIKDDIYKLRINFFECISEDNYVRGVQGTSQQVWSDLSEENNVAVMLEMKRILEEFVASKIYNFAEAEDRKRFTEDADRMFSDYRNRKVRSYNVYFDMNKFEEERSILHCYLSVVFRTMAKRGIIEIDINKRV